MKPWIQNGRPVLVDGRPAICDECPCDESYPFVPSDSECSHCVTNTTPAWRYLKISGVTGPGAAEWNRVHTLPYEESCSWNGSDPDYVSIYPDVDTIPNDGEINSNLLGSGNFAANVYEDGGQLVAVFSWSGLGDPANCAQPWGVCGGGGFRSSSTTDWSNASCEDVGQD